jgi:hypothetical protein
MVTHAEYMKALQVVKEYETREKEIIEKLKQGDKLLDSILDVRAKNAIRKANESYSKVDQLIWISDVYKYFAEWGREDLRAYRGIGKKTNDLIMAELNKHFEKNNVVKIG